MQPNNTLGFTSTNSLFTGSLSGSTINTTYSGNVRFDSTLFDPTKVYFAETSQILDRSPLGLAAANQFINANFVTWSWSGKIVNFEYLFRWNLPCSGGSPTIYTSSIYRMFAIPYETSPLPYPSNVNTIEVYGVDTIGNQTLITGQFCNTTYQHLLVRVAGSYPTGKLVAHLLYQPYNFVNMKEETGFLSPVGMMQRTCLELYQVDSDFIGGEAFFKVKLSHLAPGNYRIAAIHI
jgi:hypothetical protein